MSARDRGARVYCSTPNPTSFASCSRVTISVSSVQYEALRTRLERFRQELLDIAVPESSEDREVYHVGLQLFPLTKKS